MSSYPQISTNKNTVTRASILNQAFVSIDYTFLGKFIEGNSKQG